MKKQTIAVVAGNLRFFDGGEGRAKLFRKVCRRGFARHSAIPSGTRSSTAGNPRNDS